MRNELCLQLVHLEKCVRLCKKSTPTRPLRFAKPLPHRCAPLQAASLVQRRQVLILHLQWVAEM